MGFCKFVAGLCLFASFICGSVVGQSTVVRSEVGTLPVSATSPSDAPRFPTWMRYNGKIKLEPGQTQIALTFAIYKDRTSPDALWQETQNVTPDADGNYSVLLGAADPAGLPPQVFSSADAQWLGVRVSGQAEGERALLVSVPYAMKTLDAESLQGHTASEFVLRSEIPALLNKIAQQQNITVAQTPNGVLPFVTGTANATTVNTLSTPFEASTTTEVLLVQQDGTGYAMHAIANSNPAVFAVTTSTTTANNTIYSGNFSPSGVGLRSETLASSGHGIGVWGVSLGSDGATGVLGESPQSTGFTFGVRGKNASANGIGVFGFNSSLTGATTGVRGETRSPLGSAGVFDAWNGGKVLSGRNTGVETFSVDSLGNVNAAGSVNAPAFNGGFTGTFRGSGAGLTGVNADTLGGFAATDFVRTGSLDLSSLPSLNSTQLQVNPDPQTNQNGFAGFIRDDLDSVHSYIGQAGSQVHFRLSRSVPDSAGVKDFLIAPYKYGMAIEYGGVIEVWSKHFSVHANPSVVPGYDGAQFWVGDQLDLGGLYVTANVKSLTDTGNVIVAADTFGHTSHGSMNFVTRNLNDAFRFNNGPYNQETMFGQVFKTLTTSNIEAYNGAVTASLLANNAANAVQLGSRSANRVDIITADATPQLSVFPSGNVSIGNTTDTARLAVGPSSQFQVSNAGAVTIGGGTPILQHISTTAGIAVSALAPASCQVTSIAATGASDGDSVALGVPNALAGSGDLMLFGWVSGPDTVSVRTCNMGSGAVTASGSVRVDVWKH